MKNPKNFLMLSFILLIAGLFSQMNAMNLEQLMQDEENVVMADDLQNGLFAPTSEPADRQITVRVYTNNHFSDTRCPNILKLKNAIEAQDNHSQLTSVPTTTSSTSSSRSSSWASAPSSAATSVRTGSPKIHPEQAESKKCNQSKKFRETMTEKAIQELQLTDAQKLSKDIKEIKRILVNQVRQQNTIAAEPQNFEPEQPTKSCGCLPF